MLDRNEVSEIRGIVAEVDLKRKLDAAEVFCLEAPRFVGEVRALEPLLPAAGVAGEGGRALTAPPDSDRPDREERDPSSFHPGRPPGWRVLASHDLPDRGNLATPRGRIQLLHAVANIELCAVELALLHAADFPWMEAAFHLDWLRVAAEEVAHARMVMHRLEALGSSFGEEPVHLGLLDSAAACRGLVERMAVVPRILEARGLDVSASLRTRLVAARDEGSAAILALIYRDEIGHVTAGTRWLRRACELEGSEPEPRFLGILDEFRRRRRLRPGPIDREGRRAAGFSEHELDAMGPSVRQPPSP